MTDYNPPDDTEIAPSKAIKATTGRRLRDMSIAIAEGSSGAPRVQGVALGGRVFYAATTVAGDWLTVTDIDRVKSIEVQYYAVTPTNGDSDIQLGLSTDGGSTWSNNTILSIDAPTSEGRTTSGSFYADVISGDGIGFYNSDTASFSASAHTVTFTGLSGCNAVRVRASGLTGHYTIRVDEGTES